jgi:hypothetical protein
LVSPQDPEWQLRILEVYAKLAFRSIERAFTLGIVVYSAVAGAFFGASMSGGLKIDVVQMAILLGALLVLFLLIFAAQRKDIQRQRRIRNALRLLATGNPIPDFGRFFEA